MQPLIRKCSDAQIVVSKLELNCWRQQQHENIISALTLLQHNFHG